MDLSLSEEQEALRDALARFLAKTSSPERVREAEPLGFDERVWAGLAEMGMPAMGVPERRAAPVPTSPTWRWWPSSAASTWRPAPIVEAMVANRLVHRSGGAVAPQAVTVLALTPRRGRSGHARTRRRSRPTRSSPSTTTTSCW